MDLIIELKIKNPSDWAMLQPLLKRLRIRFIQKNEVPQELVKEPIENPTSVLDKLNALLDAGVDASYYGDPVAFQRDARHETELPFRGITGLVLINPL